MGFCIMPVTDKTREQLLDELRRLRRRVAKLESGEKNDESGVKPRHPRDERLAEHGPTDENRRQSELQYRAIVNDQTELICRWRPGGELTFVNQAYCRYFGKKQEELIGTNFMQLIPVEAHEAVRKHFASLDRDNPMGVQEHQVLAHTGEIRWQQWVNQAIFDGEGQLSGYQSVGRDITHRKRAELDLLRSREQLRDLAAHFQAVREQERATMAREIHDDVGQAMTALKIGLNRLDKQLPDEATSLRDMTRDMSRIADETMQTVQRICAELRPRLLDELGLAAAIEWQAREFQRRMGIRCEVCLDPADASLDPELTTALFRIFQESLTNVARHAEATTVTASLNWQAHELVLMVKDNGKGITAEQVGDSRSLGLIGMRERVHPWGGDVSIRGERGNGTTVTVRLPCGAPTT
jgi:PAS domain S-box-containing protein